MNLSENKRIEESRRIISKYRTFWNKPPEMIPINYAVDAPLLGNGDMGVTIGGPPEFLTFYLCKNDMWKLRSLSPIGKIVPFGHLIVEIQGLKGAQYTATQNLYEAETVLDLRHGDGRGVRISSIVAATENLLLVELEAYGGEFNVMTRSASRGRMFESACGSQSSNDDGIRDNVFWATRVFDKDVDIPTRVAAAMALKQDGADVDVGNRGELRPGKPFVFVVAMRSAFQSPNELEEAINLVKNADCKVIRKAHLEWWARFWAESYVEIGDPVIEQFYYLSNYTMASASRNPDFPPSIFGNWVTTDYPQWSGDYHLNYNHEAPYWGLYSSNHLEQADPFHAPVIHPDYIKMGQTYARDKVNCRGVLYPVGAGPLGIEPLRYRNYRGNPEPGHFMGQKSNAAHCCVNLAMRWYLTYDLDYARKVYPFIQEAALFWEDYLKFENGRYMIYDDAVHEMSGSDVNSILSLGLVRNLFELILDMAQELKTDAGKYEKWRHVLEHLSGYTLQEKDGKTVFRYTETGTPWYGYCTLGIKHIFPSGVLGPDGDPELLQAGRNTIEVMNRWFDCCDMSSIFPAAVRVGYDPHVILEHLRDVVTTRPYPNGFMRDLVAGPENCSIVPCTINEMLCMGHRGVLRLFPVWPRETDAKFANIRVWGAFLVDSSLKSGEVEYVSIHSEKGRTCTIVNPWPGREVILIRNGNCTESLRGERFNIGTSPGETVEIKVKGI